MKFGEPILVKLKALTPVFVGSGEVLTPLSYVVDSGKVCVVDPDRFLEVLSDEQRESYVSWLEPMLDELAELDLRIKEAGKNRKLKREFQNRRRDVEGRLSLDFFIKERLRVEPISFLREKDCLLYQVPCRSRPGPRGFSTHIKDIERRPYIPGSELKGAMRTSLLYAMLGDDDRRRAFLEKVEGLKGYQGLSKRDLKEKFRDVTSEVEVNLRGAKDDAKYDLLKFVSISDSEPMAVENLLIEVSCSEGTDRYTRTFLEALAEGSETTFLLSVCPASDIRLALRELDLEGLEGWLSVENLLEACYERSKDILNEEKEYFKGQGAILNQISQLKRENEPSSPLLRLGWGQGFLSTTVDLRVKQVDPELYEEGIRKPISKLRNWHTQEDNFPKTRRVLIDRNNRPTSLLGWVKLMPNPKQRDAELMAKKLEELKAKFAKR